MSSSMICQNFVQNAWKKELCSNCFKSKDEHMKLQNKTNNNSCITNKNSVSNVNARDKQDNGNFITTATTKLSSTHPANVLGKNAVNVKSKVADDAKKMKGIIKTTTTTTTKNLKRTVNFKTNLAQVIGYGGEDWSEEEEDVIAYEESNETEAPSEDEQELVRLTKVNTDYNANLSSKKLQLGKPLVDSEGRKQTLLVQVTPFGQDSHMTSRKTLTLCNKFKSTTNDAAKEVGDARKKDEKSFLSKEQPKDEKFKEVTEEVNDLTTIKEIGSFDKGEKVEEKSLLDEITETLEKSRNPIVKKIVQKEITLSKPILSVSNYTKESPTKMSAVKLNRNPVIKEKKTTYQSSKLVNLSPLIDKGADDMQKDNSKDDIAKDPFDDKDSAHGSSSLDDSSSHCGSEDSNSNDTDTSLEAKQSYENVSSHLSIPSRELVGEPDGRAESDGTDEPAPALPATPPPQLPSTPDKIKPKIPTKPSTILIRKPPSILSMGAPTSNHIVLSTFNSDKSPKILPSLQKQDSNGSDIAKKRKAPKPPNDEPTNSSIYTRKPVQMANTDCPVVREKEKRERAGSCTPKVVMSNRDSPEPAPRRSLSLSSDSLAPAGEDKKKRAKFSLKKLLRMGHSSSSSKNDVVDDKPLPKPRLVIVHPLDLKAKEANSEDSTKEQEYVNSSFVREQIKLSQQFSSDSAVSQARPPPPPRNYENYDLKPEKLPPKTSQIKHLQTTVVASNVQGAARPKETVYANIGEVRNAITPHKPQRTSSMREVKDGIVVNLSGKNVYEPINNNSNNSNMTTPANKTHGLTKADSSDHVYDYIGGNRSSSPECDSNKKELLANAAQRHHPHIAFASTGMSRSVSLTYCGSETESEIYSPYSYYGSESEVAEDDQECCYGNGLGSTGRTHKLRSKKGRSIVHKNLEDNYGAVVIANHEALAQVLENIQQTVHVPLPLRALKTTENLRWSDFQLRTTAQLSSSGSPLNASPVASATSIIIIGNYTFHQATWNLQNVTLMIAVVASSPSFSLGAFNLQPVTEFSDFVPCAYVSQQQKCVSTKSDTPIQATISVLPYLQINSIASMAELLKISKSEESGKCSAVVLLQLVNGLKALQAQGVEELPLSLNTFVLAKEIEKQEIHSRLYFMQPTEEARNSVETGTLCVIVSKVLKLLPMDATLYRLIQSLLLSERAVTLSQVKSVLEFSLWGPSDIALGSTSQEREFVLQRWLDLQRATVLHGLVCAKVQLTVYEECHLLFLVRSNAKMMCDASLLLESVR